MMFAGTYINAESAQLAHTLNRLVGSQSGERPRHLTFSANSSFEALASAIKLDFEDPRHRLYR